MLRTRIVTAIALLAVLLPVLFSRSFIAFVLVAAVFFAAAAWESFRLFGVRQPVISAAIWTSAFGGIAFTDQINAVNAFLLFAVSSAIWSVRLVPSLAIGLPPLAGIGNRLLNGLYGVTILGCFIAMVALFKHSPSYLLSVMAIVWIADIGAYFSGKAFGRHKLAPTISPGKSWEGAIGGLLIVLALAAASTTAPILADTFPVHLQAKWGWPGLFGAMTLLVAASVAGDLFESQLKRRAGAKDSSNLLPGHGGVLDRIDALIPSLPLAALFNSLL